MKYILAIVTMLSLAACNKSDGGGAASTPAAHTYGMVGSGVCYDFTTNTQVAPQSCYNSTTNVQYYMMNGQCYANSGGIVANTFCQQNQPNNPYQPYNPYQQQQPQSQQCYGWYTVFTGSGLFSYSRFCSGGCHDMVAINQYGQTVYCQ